MLASSGIVLAVVAFVRIPTKSMERSEGKSIRIPG
jgi:hypothetical protein